MHATKNRTTLHESALRLNDIRRGMRVIKCNIRFGFCHEYDVLTDPFAGYLSTKDGKRPLYPDQRKTMVIALRHVASGYITTHSLADMGVVRYDQTKTWNIQNFTIKASKAHLLPKITATGLHIARHDERVATSFWDREAMQLHDTAGEVLDRLSLLRRREKLIERRSHRHLNR